MTGAALLTAALLSLTEPGPYLAGELPPAAPAAAEPLIELPPPEDMGEGASDSQRRLQIYGFADIIYYSPLVPRSSPWLQYFSQYPAFIFGNLNLYLASDLGSRARSMVEVRFLFAPQGAEHVAEGSGDITRTSTDTQDFVEFGHTIRWGGIQIERAWVEYDVHPLVTVRAGHFLTPYGIWNVDHGSPSIVGIKRPWIIREAFFPEHQTGLEIHGRRGFGAASLGYHLTVSNGRGLADAQFDSDANKAVGGRLVFDWRGERRFTAGASLYRGQSTIAADRWAPTALLDRPAIARRTLQQFDEWALAADLRLQGQSLLLQSEIILNDRAYADHARPLASPATDALSPDLRRWGIYGLVGWRTPYWGLMPYLNLETVQLGSGAYPITPGALPHVLSSFLGVNLRPQPELILKVEGFYTVFPGAPDDGWGASPFYGFQAQVAWVF